jgi:hypothetical protein
MSKRVMTRIAIGAALLIPVLYYSTTTRRVDSTGTPISSRGYGYGYGLADSWIGGSDESCDVQPTASGTESWDVIDLSGSIPHTKFEGGTFPQRN